MTEYHLSKKCPSCKSVNALTINGPSIQCTKCDFQINYQCPICDNKLTESDFKRDAIGDYFHCDSCQHSMHVKRVQYILNNSLMVSQDTRCDLCNGPTIHRHDSNIGNRCISHPKCSGQANLFGGDRESLVFLDFETTGFEPNKDHIIEIGALKLDEEGFEHTFSMLIKPPVTISPKITQITGITNEMVASAESFGDVVHDFYKFLGKSKIIAHNADFDIPWLIYHFKKHSLTLPKNDIICTLKWARKMNEPHCSLEALTKKYKIGHNNAHRALADAAATRELYFVFEDTYRGTRKPYPITEYNNVIENYDRASAFQKKIVT